jgi:hypothetical protein
VEFINHSKNEANPEKLTSRVKIKSMLMKINLFKRPVLILFLTICSIQNIYCQNCKYKIDKKDPFTNELNRAIFLSLGPGYDLKFERLGENYFISVLITYGGEQNFAVEEGSDFAIKLLDGTLMTLKCAQKATPTSAVVANAIVSYYIVKYKCSKTEMEQISSSGIVAINPKFGSYDITRELKEKVTRKSKETALCIMRE